MADTVAEITDRSFATTVLEAEEPVLIDFWAPWCRPCRMLAPVLEAIAGERTGRLTIVKLNIDENERTPAELEVRAVPTLLLFLGGRVVKRISGAHPKRQLDAALDAALAAA